MTQPRALCLARSGDRLFEIGLRSVGYQLLDAVPQDISPEDVVIAWNRRRCDEDTIRRFERAGARVIIAENGYIGNNGYGKKLFAMALGHHCGAGKWHVGDEHRWRRHNIRLADWRSEGSEIIVLPQRAIGEPGVAMPKEWDWQIVERLRKVTKRPVRVRPHPGKEPAATALHEDIAHAWAVVTWSSGAAIKALAMGVPAFYLFKDWIAAPMAKFGIDDIENPYLGDRVPALHSIGWAQWTAEEIMNGLPFRYLCQNIA